MFSSDEDDNNDPINVPDPNDHKIRNVRCVKCNEWGHTIKGKSFFFCWFNKKNYLTNLSNFFSR